VTVVLEISVGEQHLAVRTPGFESCTQGPLAWADERALVRFYRRGPRADAHAFVNELLAVSLSTRPRPADIASLPDHERARLRCAFIAELELHRHRKDALPLGRRRSSGVHGVESATVGSANDRNWRRRCSADASLCPGSEAGHAIAFAMRRPSVR
jgi:hypothetical protein